MFLNLLSNIWQVFLDTAFWLLLGLLAAGIIKTLIPETAMKRWVGGSGLPAILRAALFGAPLPLCSCGVLPAAIGLHRAGASKEATVSFLISTPETSIDSVAVTYALMGPVMAIYRPIAALTSAIATGLLTTLAPEYTPVTQAEVSSSCCGTKSTGKESAETVLSATTQANGHPTNNIDTAQSSCCSSNDNKTACCSSTEPAARTQTGKVRQIMRYAGAELLDDIAAWMTFGIVFAGIMITFIPPGWLAQWGGGLTAMLIMLVVGIPMYICAVASTPVAAGLLLAGVSPGAVLIFLLVGPATNIASFALLKKELGLNVTLIYLAGIALVSLLMGLLLEWLLQSQGWEMTVTMGADHALLPAYLSWTSAMLLILLAIKPLRRTLLPQLG